MFKTFGHKNVFILDGAFGKWRTDNRAIETNEDGGEEADYAYTYDANLYKNISQVHDLV